LLERAGESLLEVLKKGGRYAVAGAIAGPIVELDVRTLYLKGFGIDWLYISRSSSISKFNWVY